jgi:2-C-methyl-D-erythritol 4-phosphate cytidylyltransferase / 2-C-methyl-D-erythritol 2,4-cyclodiphosphate synthase
MEARKPNIAIIVAAGGGSRVGGIIPKQYQCVNGKPMLAHSYEIFAAHKDIDQIYVVIGAGQQNLAIDALSGLKPPKLILGGAMRRDSVRHALDEIAATGGANYVLIHDAARPFLTHKIVDELLAALVHHVGAVPALAVVDSLARGSTVMEATVERDNLWRIQTPQAFHFDAILAAHAGWRADEEASDDARMAMANGHQVAFIDGDPGLSKFTFLSDFPANKGHKGAMQPFRIGTGFDVHRLVAGEDLWLCGIKIDHEFGLSGHSDADVALHAVTDAILGAAALGDIGQHFPPTDPKWRGAASDQFLHHAVKLVADLGYAVGNIDLTIICEAPQISPHRDEMRKRLAEITGTDISQISVKATTTERIGFTGRKEGIAAQAAATLILREGN